MSAAKCTEFASTSYSTPIHSDTLRKARLTEPSSSNLQAGQRMSPFGHAANVRSSDHLHAPAVARTVCIRQGIPSSFADRTAQRWLPAHRGFGVQRTGISGARCRAARGRCRLMESAVDWMPLSWW